MKTRIPLFSILFASLAGVIVMACTSNKAPAKVEVDKNIIVAIYSTSDIGGVIDTISPCLLKETVHVSELLRYPDDDGVTMPFYLSDTTKYAEITESNLDKRIAISVNGKVVSTPVVKMKLVNGACSVVLVDSQVTSLFPNINVTELIN